MDNQKPFNNNIQQASDPPAVDTYRPSDVPSAPTPKYTPKKIAIVILVVIIFAITAGLIFNQKPVQPPQEKIASNIVESATPILEQQDGWKSHTNTDLNLAFRYPTQFDLKEEKNIYTDDPEIKDWIYYNYSFSTGLLIDGEPDESGFAIVTRPTQGHTIAQAFTKPAESGGSLPSIQQLSETGGADEGAVVTNGDLIQRVYRIKNNFITITQHQYYNLLPDRSDDIAPYANQIYSTFKFSK